MAQYIRGADRDQPMLLPACVGDYVPADSPLRALDAFADSLDLGGLGFSSRDAGSLGRSGYDPRTLLKLYLWGYLKRTRSSRGLEEACTANLGAIWLTGDVVPDHSTVSDFRKENAAALKGIFREFNLVCIELGLFGRELVAIDGTFIKAVNSRANNFTKAKVEKLIAGVDAAVARYLEQLDAGDGEDREIAAGGGGDAAALREKIAKIRARKAELEGHLAACAESPTGQVSLSDPDAVALCKGGKHTVGYNAQAAVDAKHHLAASVEVTQDGNDTGQLDAMAQQAKEDLGLAPDAPLKVLADAGYGTGAELAACEGNKTVTYVAIQKTRGEGNGLYNEGDFAGDPGAEGYRCPAGQTLRRAADRQVCGTTHHTYQNSAACRGCPLKARCTTGAFRRLEVSEHKPAVDAARARLAGEPGAMRQRAAIAEHPFGTVKDRHGRHDLLCRGLELAGAETAMSFWAYNFTRAANVLGAAGLRDAIVRIVARRKAA